MEQSARAGSALIGTLWAAALCLGFNGLLNYSSAPSDPGVPVNTWPENTALGARTGDPELLMFVHALCPCTRASLSELERVLCRATMLPRTRVVLWTDPQQAERFAHSGLRERLREVAAIEVIEDPAGHLAQAFGCQTSGMTLFFDGSGRLRFAGGLTPSRGHEGVSAGTLALDVLLGGGVSERIAAPVFGCSLEATPERTL